jgi:hypothetical protein
MTTGTGGGLGVRSDVLLAYLVGDTDMVTDEL